MQDYPRDIYTEPSVIDIDTLRNLGPLSGMAGTWQGARGLDINPKPEGARKQAYIERIELQPIDPQTNGPQLLYGLRYHTHITKPGQAKTYHDQVGYWLWEPATGTVIHTIAIPRGQVAMAAGHADSNATSFELAATQGLDSWGICSAPFLLHAFRTIEFRINVEFHGDGTWSYNEDTILQILGQQEPFHHTDRNTLTRIAPPLANPSART